MQRAPARAREHKHRHHHQHPTSTAPPPAPPPSAAIDFSSISCFVSLPSPCTIFDLASSIDRSISLSPKESQRYHFHYSDFENFSAADYESVISERLNCFARIESPEFDQALKHHIEQFIPGLQLGVFVSMTSHVLRHEKTAGHGLLLVLDCALRHFAQQRLMLEKCTEKIIANGPVLCWLLGRVLAAGIIIPVSSLMKQFEKYLLSREARAASLAVNIAHILRRAVHRKAAVKASQYVTLIKLSERRDTARDRHVRDVLAPVFFSVTVSDVPVYAGALISAFPDCPPFIHAVFLNGARRSGRFLQGWVTECRGRNAAAALRYLRILADRLPVEILKRFPEKTAPVLEQEQRRVDEIRARLHQVSHRLCLTLALVFVLWRCASRA
jgi:hypothetical protein